PSILVAPRVGVRGHRVAMRRESRQRYLDLQPLVGRAVRMNRHHLNVPGHPSTPRLIRRGEIGRYQAEPYRLDIPIQAMVRLTATTSILSVSALTPKPIVSALTLSV